VSLFGTNVKDFFKIFSNFFSRGTAQRKALHKRQLTKNPGDQRERETNFFNAEPVNFNAKSPREGNSTQRRKGLARQSRNQKEEKLCQKCVNLRHSTAKLKDGEWDSRICPQMTQIDADWQGRDGRRLLIAGGHGRTNHGMGSFLSHLFSTAGCASN
jgi:hypothetical protein